MKYVIEILKKELRKEKNYQTTHNKCLRDGVGNVSDKRAFEMSVRIAQKRIPELEQALDIIQKQNHLKT